MREVVAAIDPNVGGPPQVGRVRKVVFYALTAFLTVGLVTRFWKVNLFPILVWFPDDFVNASYAYDVEMMSIHRIHELALALSHLLITFGVAIQLWKPTRRIAPMWQASGSMAISVLLLLVVRPPLEGVGAFVYVVLGLVVLLGFLHPATALSPLPRPHDRPMTLLWLAAAVPLLIYSLDQIGLQLSGVAADPHWAHSHYQMVGEYGMHLILAGLLGAGVLTGWRITAWWAVSLAAIMGAAFIAYPSAPSSRGVGWGLGLLTWAVAYAIATERRARAAHPRIERVSSGRLTENPG